MIEVAERSGAGSPVVRYIVSSALGRTVSVFRGANGMSGADAGGFRFGRLSAEGRISDFSKEEAASGAGCPSAFGCAFTKLEDGQ
ncbi:hypothetical protein [uncultured Roseibium sp.]|uniref:hypothetical protein n=1 Tax=uncultured Roseibium sp. TaxID=1936171 RepID=UPI003216C659